MASATRSQRAYVGTIPTLTPGIKIGGHFELSANGTAAFLDTRLQCYLRLVEKAKQRNDCLVKKHITIRLPNGEEKDGISHVTTAQDIADSLKIKGGIVARIAFTDDNAFPDSTAVADALSDDENCIEDAPTEEVVEKTYLWDMSRPFPASVKLEILKYDCPEARSAFWHSSAHLLGAVIEERFGAKVTIGPALQKGFYYDFYVGDELAFKAENSDELKAIAQKLVNGPEIPFERLEVEKDDALELFQDNPFKLAIIQNKVGEDQKTTVYRCGRFIDLCMGPHIPKLNLIKAFEIEKFSSCYWLGDAKGDSLQRVYGVAFPDVKMMKDHIKIMEEAARRDHRNLGLQLGYFFFEPIYSPGSAFWTPLGTKIYNKLCNLMRQEYIFRGFQEVNTPNLFSSDLFKVSGHLANYKENMFCLDIEGKEWSLKPMNCPSHCCIFKHLQLSYRQLPLRLADFGVLHRNEFSGALSGLTRVRRFQQDDAHIFCSLEQVKQEVADALEFLFFVYKCFDFKFELHLATRPKKALGDLDLWTKAEAQLQEALTACPFPWKINKGDGAFYGPKIDIKLFDALGRSHQCGTIQLDFQLPLRFDLQYHSSETSTPGAENVDQPKGTDKKEAGQVKPETNSNSPDGSLESPLKPGHARPIMIHRAILGSIERMTAVILEHTGGKLPFWLSPRQAIICPVSEKYIAYAQYVKAILVHRGFDVDADVSKNTINKKIRGASVQKWNYVLVVGATEEENRTVMVRSHDASQEQVQMNMSELVNFFDEMRDITGRRQLTIPEYVPPTNN